MEYKITRFEKIGDQMFIRIDDVNKPVYVEHFFTEEEKQDINGTIERLIAELEVMAEEYNEEPTTKSKLNEIKNLVIDINNVIWKR